MARLALLGKHQHGLGVFVLDAGQWLLAKVGDIQRELPRGVRVQPHPDVVDGCPQLSLGRIPRDQARDEALYLWGRQIRQPATAGVFAAHTF
jgi:hypothetical protein